MTEGATRLSAAVQQLPPQLALVAVRGKAAIGSGWQRKGHHRQRIAQLLSSGEATGVGMLSGPISGGILLVDHDGGAAGPVLQELLQGQPLPPSWQWSSGRPGRWQLALQVPERYWQAMRNKRVMATGTTGEQLELRWTGHQSVLPPSIHPDTKEPYRWLPGRCPADLPLAEAPITLIEAMLKPPAPAAPPTTPPPATGLALPLIEFISQWTRQLIESGGTPGSWNDDQLKAAADLVGTEQWILQQGHRPTPTARELWQQHITAAAAKDSSFNARRAWQRFEGTRPDVTPSTDLPNLQRRLAYHQRQERRASRGSTAQHGAPTTDDAPTPQNPTAAPQKRKDAPLTPAQKITRLRRLAAELVANGTAFADRLPLLRAEAEALDLTLRDDELRRYVWDARRAAAGGAGLIAPGAWLDITPTRWLWEGMVMPAALNLLVALPKVGKTSLMLGMLGAWCRGEESFLGMPLIGPCPPVLIVGTDQPLSDWARMLEEVGLLETTGDSSGKMRGRILPPLVGLAHSGQSLHLSPEGIETIATYAADNPGLFVLIDSIAAVTGPLGIDENSAEIAEPIRDLMEAVEPHGATVVAIHHASKGRAAEGAALASRGSTALPAVASQVISLAQMASSNPAAPHDPRIVVKTSGRAGAPRQLLIERRDDGWVSHGSAESVAFAQRLQELEDGLNDRQADVLDLVREAWEDGSRRTDARAIAGAIDMGAHGADIALRTLKALAKKGLLQSAKEVGLQGRATWFWPVEAAPARGVPTPPRGGLLDASEPSEVSEPTQRQLAKPLTRRGGSDTSDTSDSPDSPPRDPCRNLPEPPPAGRDP
ncbi:MAG: AAA family ATPase, partial [Synechococcaceae cyanobacterium]|nr:AAA family ATPase [Synechococcaceae cyanobacterium]